jgi:uncharacterized protein YjiS (DUF1127 family)
MTRAIRNWLQLRRRRALERQLRSLSAEDLAALSIPPAEVEHLIFELSQV